MRPSATCFKPTSKTLRRAGTLEETGVFVNQYALRRLCGRRLMGETLCAVVGAAARLLEHACQQPGQPAVAEIALRGGRRLRL